MANITSSQLSMVANLGGGGGGGGGEEIEISVNLIDHCGTLTIRCLVTENQHNKNIYMTASLEISAAIGFARELDSLYMSKVSQI